MKGKESMFLFTDTEMANIAYYNDLSEFLADAKENGEMTEDESKFIGCYSLCNTYSKTFTEVQRFEYIRKLNIALKTRNTLPVYSFVTY